jgi:hypothetical protein
MVLETKRSLIYCSFTALLRKSLSINGVGDGNRILVIITKADLCENPTEHS